MEPVTQSDFNNNIYNSNYYLSYQRGLFGWNCWTHVHCRHHCRGSRDRRPGHPRREDAEDRGDNQVVLSGQHHLCDSHVVSSPAARCGRVYLHISGISWSLCHRRISAGFGGSSRGNIPSWSSHRDMLHIFLIFSSRSVSNGDWKLAWLSSTWRVQ